MSLLRNGITTPVVSRCGFLRGLILLPVVIINIIARSRLVKKV
ncbi:MAG: hypothetical protein ACRCT1_04380 [Microcoleaceae cyanobacterium]